MCCIQIPRDRNLKRILSESDDVITILEQNAKRRATMVGETTTGELDSPRKLRRIVKFTEPCDSEKFSSLYILDGDVKSVIWYDQSELEAMKAEARDSCDLIKCALPSIDRTNLYPGSASCISSLADVLHTSSKTQQRHRLEWQPMLALNSATRGLEQRLCIERQRRKYLVTRFVLKSASNLCLNHPKNSEKLALATVRCTRYATALAIEEAARDYLRAYGDMQNNPYDR